MKNTYETKAEILVKISNVETDSEKKIEDFKHELFTLYKKDSQVVAFLKAAENYENPEYSFDECGDLIASFSPSFSLAEYPYFSDFVLSEEVGTFTEGKIISFCGSYISVNFNHGRNGCFVFDADLGKAIIKNQKDVNPMAVPALIEKHQRTKGEFGDIVEVDYYGQYIKHYEVGQTIRDLTDSELDSFLDTFNTEEE